MGSTTCNGVASAGPDAPLRPSARNDIALRRVIEKYWQTQVRKPRPIFTHAERILGKPNHEDSRPGSYLPDRADIILTQARDPFHTCAEPRRTPDGRSSSMKPAPFRYIAARSLEQALALKAEYGEEARFLAGGQSLVPTMNFRLTQPAVLIDINPLTQLSGMQKSGPDSLYIGALTRYRDLERDPATAQDRPLVAEALPHIAHPQIRNRGTIGGNLAHADPASEMPAIVVALAGQLRAQSTRGDRWIAAAEFFAGALATTLAADEMLVEVKLPAAKPRSGACFMEVARRRGDFALIGVACTVRIDDDGRCAEARIGLCNAGDKPILAEEAGASLVGRPIGTAQIDEAGELVQRAIDPGGSIHASKEFQRHLAGVLTKRALAEANTRAQRGL
jgi:CO/xanthine dehydrogenase FAD-binding subunit